MAEKNESLLYKAWHAVSHSTAWNAFHLLCTLPMTVMWLAHGGVVGLLPNIFNHAVASVPMIPDAISAVTGDLGKLAGVFGLSAAPVATVASASTATAATAATAAATPAIPAGCHMMGTELMCGAM